MAKRLLQVANAEGLQVNEVYSLLNAVALTFLVRVFVSNYACTCCFYLDCMSLSY